MLGSTAPLHSGVMRSASSEASVAQRQASRGDNSFHTAATLGQNTHTTALQASREAEDASTATTTATSTTSITAQSPSAASPTEVTYTASLHSGLSYVASRIATLLASVLKYIRNLSIRPKNREYLEHTSMMIFDGDNNVRIYLCNLVHSRAFESFIISVIAINCIVLALDDPTTSEEPEYQQSFNQFFLVVFAVEVCMKLIVFGFALHPGAYLRNGWNVVDFSIVVLSFMQLIPNFGNFTAFRTLRVVRPLRSMNAIPQLKTIASCLAHSVKGLANVCLLALFTFLVFAILAVQLWMGTLAFRCAAIYDGTIDPEMFCSPSADGSSGLSGAACPSGYHCVYYGNPNNGYVSFDNVPMGFMVVFQTITLEGWSQLMYSAMDACGWPIAVFFVLIVVVGCYFVLNLCLAVICFQFEKVKQRALEQEVEDAKREEMEIRKSEEGMQRARGSLRLIPGTTEYALAGTEGGALTTSGTPLFGDCADVHRVLDPSRLRHCNSKEGLSPQERCLLIRQLSQTAAGNLLLVALHEDLFAVPEHSEVDPSHLAYEFMDKQRPKLRSWLRILYLIRLRMFEWFDTDPVIAHMHAQWNIEAKKLLALGRGEDAERLKQSTEPPMPWFAKVTAVCIMGNTIMMAAQRFQQSDEQTNISNIASIAFTSIFALELLVKLFYLSPYWFCRDALNVFDGSVTLVSVAEVIFLSGTSRFSVFRAFRTLRLVRLVQGIPSLRQLTEVFELAARECGYLFVIFGLYVLIAALVGMQLFSDSLQRNGLLDSDPVRSSFGNFIMALCAILQINTYDSWPNIMWNSMEATTPVAVVFYVVCIVIGNLCITNLLVAIMINSFEEYTKKQAVSRHRVLKMFGNDVDSSDDEGDQPVIRRGITVTVLASDGRFTSLLPRAANDFLVNEVYSSRFRDPSDLANRNGESDRESSGSAEEMAPALDDSDDEGSNSDIASEASRQRCAVCGAALKTLLPRATKSLTTMSPGEWHDSICEKIQFRRVKSRVIKTLLRGMPSVEDHVAIAVRPEKHPFAMDLLESLEHSLNDSCPNNVQPAVPSAANIEDVFGRAWEVGLLLGENVEDYIHGRSWEPVKRLLLAEQALHDLHIGEEQVGGALRAYAKANITNQCLTNGGHSLFLFAPEHWLRVQLTQLVMWPVFDYFVFCVIVASSVALALDNPSNDPSITADLTLAGKIFAVIFYVEFLLKVIAFGFVVAEGSYLRDPWNWLDFVVVLVTVTSWIAEAFSASGVGFLMILRTLRVLRPLRMVNKYRGLRMVVLTLLHSIKGITNMTLILVMVYLVFAILSVQLFGGLLWHCNDSTVLLRTECNGTFWNNFSAPGTIVSTMDTADGSAITQEVIAYVNYTVLGNREWVNADFHFDDAYHSLVSLLHIATLDNWGETMYAVVDSSDYDHGPIPWVNAPYALFFIVFVLVGALFLLNMYVGLIVEQFQNTKDRLDGVGVLTDDQRLWVETQRMVLNYRPQVLRIPGKYAFQRTIASICERPLFELGSAFVVILNVIVIGMEHTGQSEELSSLLDALNIVCTALFVSEAVIKVFGYGHRYFLEGWNRFDFFLMVLGIVDIATSGEVLPINVGLLRILRVFRIARVFALVRKARDIRVLVETLWYSLPSLANIGAFMFLVLFIFTVLGVQIFGQVTRDGVGLTRHMNFESFGNGFLFLIQVTTMDNWGATMISLENTVGCGADVSPDGVDHCGTPFAPLFFFPFILINGYVMVNLFCAIILDNFDTTMKLDASRLKVADLKKFTEVWARFDPDATMLMKTRYFPELLAALKPPLGIERKTDRVKLLKLARDHSIPEHKGEIHFVETLIPLARTVLGVQFEDAELREHERMWMHQFPELNTLPLVRYREKRVTVDQYFAATYIASAVRRRLARRAVQCLRQDKRDDLITWYEDQNIPEVEWAAVLRMQREEDQRRHHLTEHRKMILEMLRQVRSGADDSFSAEGEDVFDPMPLEEEKLQARVFDPHPLQQMVRETVYDRRGTVLKSNRRQSLGLSGFSQLWAKHTTDL